MQYEVKSAGKVFPNEKAARRIPYEFQSKAMAMLDIINKEQSFSTLVVLPTGGGKTFTASYWLLKNALDNGKKILWIAHRQMLLDQAAQSFQSYAYPERMAHIASFSYRIVSGSSEHDRTCDIRADDNLLIISKDSIGRNLNRLDAWLSGEDEVYVVVDEAHHSTAKTYRKVLDYVKEKVPCVKLLGLTATPFRTAEDEQGLLSKIYSDGIKNGCAVHGQVGIAYHIGLKELISQQILSMPKFESYYTEQNYGASLGLAALESIQQLDTLPEELASEIAENAARNRLIVDTYKKNAAEYKQTIVFAINKAHAIALNGLFTHAGIKSAFVISALKDKGTNATIGQAENDLNLERYRNGEIQVLINVNILTEGVDLPQTQTVFLARPTVSTILMTQMIGRALRGTAAGGTSSAYIVSFVDNWNEHIAWVNPESLFEGENSFDSTEPKERAQRDVQMIAVSKIEEFAAIMDDSIDTTALENVPFSQRIPVGMYAFSYLEENGMDSSYQVMVYDSTREAYKKFMDALPELFAAWGTDEEYLPDETLNRMENECRSSFFRGDMIPPYEKKDVIRILKYYAQYSEAPSFYTFDDIDTGRLDVHQIASHIVEEDMGPRKENEYLNGLWDDNDDNLLRLFFGRKTYFHRQIDIEKQKLLNPDEVQKSVVQYDRRKLEDLPLHRIWALDPAYFFELQDGAFAKAKTANGTYRCAKCGKEFPNRRGLEIDHIVAMNNGGKSVPDNLQVLCCRCNRKKGDNK